MKKLNFTETVEYWKENYDTMEKKLREDKADLSLVCFRDKTKWENQFYDYFQNRIFQKLLQRVGNIKDKDTLDIGTGIGRWAKRLANRGGNVIGIDLDEKVIQKNLEFYPDIKFVPMSCTDLTFKDNSFDLVTSVTVLQHIPYEEQKRAIREIVRVTRKGGHILILESAYVKSICESVFPNSQKKWSELFIEQDCEEVTHLGQEYTPLLNISEIFRLGVNRFSPIKIKTKWLYFNVKRAIVGLSYPIEFFCEYCLSESFGKKTGLLFRKN